MELLYFIARFIFFVCESMLVIRLRFFLIEDELWPLEEYRDSIVLIGEADIHIPLVLNYTFLIHIVQALLVLTLIGVLLLRSSDWLLLMVLDYTFNWTTAEVSTDW